MPPALVPAMAGGIANVLQQMAYLCGARWLVPFEVGNSAVCIGSPDVAVRRGKGHPSRPVNRVYPGFCKQSSLLQADAFLGAQ